MNLKERVETLRRTAWLRDASETLLLELASHAQTQQVQANETLFLEGEALESVIVIASGFARTYRFDARHAREFTIGVYGAQQTLGLIATFLEPSRALASAVMLEVGMVVRVDANALRGVVARDAQLASSLLRHIAARHARLTERVDALFFLDLNARLAALLLERDAPEGWLLPQNSVLAAQLGTVPELVSRKLGEFFRRGWIRLERRRVWVVDRAALEAHS